MKRCTVYIAVEALAPTEETLEDAVTDVIQAFTASGRPIYDVRLELLDQDALIGKPPEA